MEKKITSNTTVITPSSEKENKFPYVREIRDLKELNSLGCHYINTANQGNSTRMITRSMRWLSVRRGKRGGYMSPEQEKACQRIDELLEMDENNIERNLNLNVLLEKDPRTQPALSTSEQMNIHGLPQGTYVLLMKENGNVIAQTKVIIQ